MKQAVDKKNQSDQVLRKKPDHAIGKYTIKYIGKERKFVLRHVITQEPPPKRIVSKQAQIIANAQKAFQAEVRKAIALNDYGQTPKIRKLQEEIMENAREALDEAENMAKEIGLEELSLQKQNVITSAADMESDSNNPGPSSIQNNNLTHNLQTAMTALSLIESAMDDA